MVKNQNLLKMKFETSYSNQLENFIKTNLKNSHYAPPLLAGDLGSMIFLAQKDLQRGTTENTDTICGDTESGTCPNTVTFYL